MNQFNQQQQPQQQQPNMQNPNYQQGQSPAFNQYGQSPYVQNPNFNFQNPNPQFVQPQNFNQFGQSPNFQNPNPQFVQPPPVNQYGQSPQNDGTRQNDGSNFTQNQFYQMQSNQPTGQNFQFHQSDYVLKKKVKIQHDDLINFQDSTATNNQGKTHDEILLKETVQKSMYELVPKELQADLIHEFFDLYPFMSRPNIKNIQKSIQSKFRKTVFQCIIGDVIYERQQKSEFEKQWKLKLQSVEDPDFQSNTKFQIQKQGDERLVTVTHSIGDWDTKIGALLRREASMNLIDKCQARGNTCGNPKNVCMEMCRCLAICQVCYTTPIIMQALNNCPVCGLAFHGRKAGFRCIF